MPLTKKSSAGNRKLAVLFNNWNNLWLLLRKTVYIISWWIKVINMT